MDIYIHSIYAALIPQSIREHTDYTLVSSGRRHRRRDVVIVDVVVVVFVLYRSLYEYEIPLFTMLTEDPLTWKSYSVTYFCTL